MKNLFFVLVIVLATVCFAEEITPVLVPVDRSTFAGTDTQFWVIYLNSGTAPITVHIPAEYPITLESQPLVFHQKLKRMDNISEQTIPPGGFCRVKFSTEFPKVNGSVTIEIEKPGATPVVIVSATGPGAANRPEATLAHPETSPAEAKATSTAATTVASAGENKSVPAKSDQWSDSPFVESFAGRISTYEPMYFIAGSSPTVKFQLSLKYKIFDEGGKLAEKYSPLNHLYLAYSQTSFWDLASSDPKFTSNSYRPELMFNYDNILKADSHFWNLSQLGMQGGFEHESNGTGGTAERSMNIIYIRPIFMWDIDKANDWFVSVAPRVFAYVTTGEYTQDIAQYRGYGDLRVVFGQRFGPQIAAVARIGEDFDKGSLELDLSQPLRPRTRGDLDLYLYAQFFTGYGDQLSYYNKSSTTFRVGIGFVR